MLQVADSGRHWIYQSASILGYHVSLPPAAELRQPRLETVYVRGARLRILTSTVRVDGRSFLVEVAQPLDPYYEMLYRFRRLALWFLPLVLVLSWAGGYWLCRRTLAPVDEIASAARSISARNLNLRLRVPHTGDELQRLSETMNAMIARLNKAFTRISEFTADAAHELRTPISLILTTAELALREGESATVYHSALREIYSEAVRTKDLIDDLMMLARADSGEDRLQMCDTDLSAAARVACHRGAVLAQAKAITFLSDIPDGQLRVMGDSHGLTRLFSILLENAVKYTPERGTVAVSLREAASEFVCEVKDSGIGIAQEDIGRVFERFYRADRSRSREGGGAGLGLALAQCIADAHKATIEVESQLGLGSTFRVRLPLPMT